MFYMFRQNNSGGHFYGPEIVIVRAKNAEEANNKACDEAGVYFNGVSSGKDCRCCGDRWTPVCEYDATEAPECYGDPISLENLDNNILTRYEKYMVRYVP